MLINYTKPNAETSPEDIAAAARDELWGAYTQALVDAGILVGGEARHPPHTATTLRVTEGIRDIQDGPYSDTKEQFGGFYIIDVADLDTALAWAARNPAASLGAVEVRPVITRGP